MARLIGILVLIIDILAIFDVLKNVKVLERKILWIAVILLLPFFGAMAWYAVSRKIIKL